MSIWNWVWAFNARAVDEGDRRRSRLLETLNEAGRLRADNPGQALAMYEQGRRDAAALGEHWWTLLFDHWRLQTMLFHTHNLQAAADLAVRATLEARKPEYERLPQRACLHEDLIHVYVRSDPLGNAPLIVDALEYMDSQVSPSMECYQCLRQLRGLFAIETGELVEANRLGLRILRFADERNDYERTYYRSVASALLSRVAWKRGDWRELHAWAVLGEEAARGEISKQGLLEAMAWQALAERRMGNQWAARRQHLRTTMQARQSGSGTPGDIYFDILAEYHVAGGDPQKALKAREQQLALLLGTGRTAAEAACRVDRCRLLGQLGRPFSRDLEEARFAASALKAPEPVLSELGRIERGDYTRHPH